MSSPRGKAMTETITQEGHANRAEALVNKALVLGLLPDQFAEDKTFHAQLAQFIYDSTLPSVSDRKSGYYADIIKILGTEIFDNRDKIYIENYQRDSPAMVFTFEMGLDRSPLPPVVRGGHVDSDLDRAVDKFNNTPTENPGGAVVRPR